MRFLLDTHVLMWAVNDQARLDATTRSLLISGENDILFSAASIWEIAIKARLRRADFEARPEEVLQAARTIGFVELPIKADLTVLVADLPLHHRDPFDRLLIVQAMTDLMRLLTADPVLVQYSELITLVG